MRANLLHALTVAAVAMTAACSAPDAVAPNAASPRRSASAANEGISTASYPIDRYEWNACANNGAGEVIRTTGQLRYDVQRTQDSSGVYHFSIKSNTSDLTAVGLTTGDVYHGVMTERVNSRATDYLNMDLRTADIIRFVSSAHGDDWFLSVRTHIVIDEGNYELWLEDWQETCR